MMSDAEALGTITAAIDETVLALLPAGEDPRWFLACSGEVFRITLVRRRPNGTVWFEGVPVEWKPDRYAEARELAEQTCAQARAVVERLALNGAAS